MMPLRSTLGACAVAVALAGCGGAFDLPPGLSWGDPVVPGYVHQPRLVITDNGDDTLAMVAVDGLQPRLLALAPVGNSPFELELPHHIGASPDGRTLYYNLSNAAPSGGGTGPHGSHGNALVPGYLVKLDAATLRPLGQVLVDRSPGDVIVSPDGALAFVSHYDLARLNAQLSAGAPAQQGYSSVAIVDTATMALLSMTPLCPAAHGMGLSPSGKQLYVTCTQSDQIAVLDYSDPRHPIPIPAPPGLTAVGPDPGPVGQPRYAPYALTVARDGRVWISDNADLLAGGSPGVRVFDPQKPAVVPSQGVALDGPAMFGDLAPADTPSPGAPAGRYLYVPTQGQRSAVHEIDTAATPPVVTRRLELPAAQCLSAHALLVLSGRRAAVVCEGDHVTRKGTLVVVDLAGWALGGVAELGLYPDGVVSLPAL